MSKTSNTDNGSSIVTKRTLSLLGTESQYGLGFFQVKGEETAQGVPTCLIINNPLKTKWKHDEFPEKWQAVYGSMRAPEAGPVIEEGSTPQNTTAATDESITPPPENSILELKLKDSGKNGSGQQSSVMRDFASSDTVRPPVDELYLEKGFPCITALDGTGYYVALRNERFVGFRNNQSTSGLSNEEFEHLLDFEVLAPSVHKETIYDQLVYQDRVQLYMQAST